MNTTLKLTPRQGHVLQYLARFLAHNHQLPPRQDICAAFGWRSPQAACDILKRLQTAGALERNDVGGLRITARGLATAQQLEAPR